MNALPALEARGDYVTLIREVRARVAEDPQAFSDAFIQRWCGRRWRNLFISDAVHDPVALAAASRDRPWRSDPRPPRRKVAERFLKGEGRNEWQTEMPAAQAGVSKTTLLFCPGLLNGLLPVRAFAEALPAVQRRFGCPVLRADLHPARGCEANVDNLVRALEQGHGLTADARPVSAEQATPPGDVFAVAYSKGAADLLTFLVQRPDLAGRVRAVFSWAGAIGGSVIADGEHGRIQRLGLGPAEDKLQATLRRLAPRLPDTRVLRSLEEVDVTDAARDLTTAHRQAFLQRHRDALEALRFPVFTVAASTSLREVPHFQRKGYRTLRQEEEHNDMQLAASKTRLPGPPGVDLGLVRGHHWDVAYPPFPTALRLFSRRLKHPFPKTAAVTAMVQLAAELGLVE